MCDKLVYLKDYIQNCHRLFIFFVLIVNLIIITIAFCNQMQSFKYITIFAFKKGAISPKKRNARNATRVNLIILIDGLLTVL